MAKSQKTIEAYKNVITNFSAKTNINEPNMVKKVIKDYEDMKNQQLKTKRKQIQKKVESLGFINSDLSVGVSSHFGCKFWKTKYDNVYITDYNYAYSNDKDFNPYLIDEDLLLICNSYTGYWLLISILLLDNIKELNEKINLVYKS